MDRGLIFWDVDTQYDFMMADGALPAPGAEAIVDRVSQVRRFALENGFSLIGDVDWHSPDDDEISDDPDFVTTFPPHCMAGTEGAERLGWLGDLPIRYVDIAPTPDDQLRSLIAAQPFHVIIRKNTLDVFDNPNTRRLIDMIDPGAVVVFGVALDFCVSYVLKGLADRPGLKRYLLKDAVKGLGQTPEQQICADFEESGVVVTDLDHLREQLSCG